MIGRLSTLTLGIAAVSSFTLLSLVQTGLAQQAAPPAVSATTASATVVPSLVNYSGVLTGSSGKPLSGVVGITFSLYKDEQGGAPLWLETQNVKLDVTGHYGVQLGATSAHGLPADLFITGEARWLALQVGNEAEKPRVLLVAVPYAMKASDAETLGGLPASAFLLAAPVSPASSTSAPAAATASQTTAPPAAAITGTGTLNFLPLWTGAATIGNSVAFQSGTGATAKLGINTTTPTTTLDVKGAGTIRGILTLPATPAATAAAGKPSVPFSLVASAFNSTTAAPVSEVFNWQAESTGNNTATPGATMNLLFGVGATKPAETGLKIASNGLVTFATGQTFPGTSTITGITAGSGLSGGGTTGNITLSLPTTCATNQILKWTGTTWACSAAGGGTGTITGVTAGTGLTGGGTTGTVTLNIDTTKIPQLGTANGFTGNQSVSGNITSNGTVSGSIVNTLTGFYILGNPFAIGSQNTANAFFGFGGNQTMTGGDNVATGNASFINNTTGNLDTAYGVGTLRSNTTGSSNSSLGTFALASNTTGGSNTAVGNNALTNITTGSNNTALGANAGPDISHGTLTNATAIGANALVSASNALVLGGTGANAVSVGIGTATPAATLDVHGTANFTGPITFAAGQTFPGNGTITGVIAGTDLVGGGTTGNVTLNVDTSKVVSGVVAGSGLTGGGTGGVPTLSLDTTKVPQLNLANTFTGNQTVNGNLSATGAVSASILQIGGIQFAFGNFGNLNAYLGFAGNTLETGQGNVGVGPFAMTSDTTGEVNTAVGGSTLSQNTTGAANAAFGFGALQNNTTATGNSGVGYNALNSDTTGELNTAVGDAALISDTSGSGNTAIGSDSMQSTSIGSANTAVGYSTLANNLNGNYNSALGAYAGTGSASLSNATAIGAFASVSQNNSIVLGGITGVNGGTDTNVGVGTTSPAYRLHIGTSNNGLRVEGPATSGGMAASFGGFGDFGIDALGCVSCRFVVKDTGALGPVQVGIGTSTPDATLSVYGTADKLGGGSWNTYSDGRLKNLHGAFTPGLKQLLQLHPIRYEYKPDNALGIHDPNEHIGFVAQEVQRVIPEAVAESSRGYLTVNNDPILWTMLNAIKEQQKEIATLRAQLKKQSANNKSLEARLTHIEQGSGKAGTTKRAALRTSK